jgi:hypothetical protein
MLAYTHTNNCKKVKSPWGVGRAREREERKSARARAPVVLAPALGLLGTSFTHKLNPRFLLL